MDEKAKMNDTSRETAHATRTQPDVIEILRDSGLVDEAWYLQAYPDVADGGQDPVEHYVRFGACEGRNPNAYFDTLWYVRNYPDVGTAEINPLLHYFVDGANEGRNASKTFCTAYYLANNPDVAKEGKNPLAHYLRSGLREGRLARPYHFGR